MKYDESTESKYIPIDAPHIKSGETFDKASIDKHPATSDLCSDLFDCARVMYYGDNWCELLFPSLFLDKCRGND